MSVVVTPPRTVVQAWLALVVLGTVTSTLAALVGGPPVPWLAALAVLALAWAKARLILGAYLGLDAVPAWRRGFELVLALYALLLLALFLLPTL